MFNRIETKVLALFVFGVVLWVTLLGFFFYFVAARSLEAQVDSNLKTTASVLASQWDASMLLLLHPGMEQAPLYRTFAQRLRLLQEHAQVNGIYIATLDRKNIVSTDGRILIGQSLPRLDLLQAEMAQATAGHVASSKLVDVNGQKYKSALAPVRSGERVAAVLMVDMSPWYLLYLRSFRNSLLVFTAIALCFCAVSARWFSRSITRPISRIVGSVEEIGKAQYEKPLEVRGGDELAQLGASIEAMRQNILRRDAQMKMMLSGIAHEIRNPLGGIELFAGILEKETLNGDQAEYIRKIQAEVANLKQILNEFLDFARPHGLQYETLRVDELMSEVQQVVGQEFRLKEARVSLEVEPEVLVVQADRFRLKQAFFNLYRNAFQAVPSGGEVASVVSKNGSGLVIRISNTTHGGLNRDFEQKIFEPFFTTKEKGIGLGLPLAKRIIEAHGGQLTLLENEESRITFAIKLPLGVVGAGL